MKCVRQKPHGVEQVEYHQQPPDATFLNGWVDDDSYGDETGAPIHEHPRDRIRVIELQYRRYSEKY